MHPRICRHPAAACLLALIVLCIALATPKPTRAAQNRYDLFQQIDYSATRGFSLRFENQTDGNAVCTPATLKLVLALGDGSQWHYLATPVSLLRMDKEYVAEARIGHGSARLTVADPSVGIAAGPLMPSAASDQAAFQPSAQAAAAGLQEGWASDPASYFVVPLAVSLTQGSGSSYAATPFFHDRYPMRSTKQLFLDPEIGRTYPSLKLKADSPFTLAVHFRLITRPVNAAALGPLFDATGQAISARWPGQSRTDADLRRDRALEQRHLAVWSASPAESSDPYGGWRGAGWHEEPGAAFRAARHGGKWWLITPDGNPCFYIGMDTAPSPVWDKTPVTGREALFAALPPRTGATAAVWGVNPWGSDGATEYVSFCGANLARKYGPDWQSVFAAVTKRRLRAWGFSGLGKWSQPPLGLCDWPVLNRAGVPTLAGHPDVFDPAVQRALYTALSNQIAPRLGDKTVVAWTLGNEHDEIITPDEVKTILGMGAAVPARHAMIESVLNFTYSGDIARLAAAWKIAPIPPSRDSLYAATQLTPPDADVEQMRVFYEKTYYALIYKTVKSIDPGHLYAGFWIVPGWWVNDSDWTSIAASCDLIGYDLYSYRFADAHLLGLMRASDKPVFCGEFSFPPSYNGARGFGVYTQAYSQDDADAGRLYAKMLRDAATNPYCVGVAWFQYRDEPQSGRGPGHGPDPVYGEHYAFGTLTIADQPKWALIDAMRAANRSVNAIHAAFK